MNMKGKEEEKVEFHKEEKSEGKSAELHKGVKRKYKKRGNKHLV